MTVRRHFLSHGLRHAAGLSLLPLLPPAWSAGTTPTPRLRHPTGRPFRILMLTFRGETDVDRGFRAYLADAGLVTGTALPPSLFADMAGALMASEAVLQAQLARSQGGRGVCLDVALADAAHWLALPRQWGLTLPGGDVGGAHAGYRVYACADGCVAMAALEPHFALRLCAAAGVPGAEQVGPAAMADLMRAPSTHACIAAFVQSRTRAALQALATAHDIPLHTLA